MSKFIYTTTEGNDIDLTDPEVSEYELDDDAAVKRVNTPHAEFPHNGGSFCVTCILDSDKCDPQFHPLSWIEHTIICCICHRRAPVSTAHYHQGEYIGDECCWDDRLKASE